MRVVSHGAVFTYWAGFIVGSFIIRVVSLDGARILLGIET